VEVLGNRIRTRVVRYPVDGCHDYDTCRALVRRELPTNEPYVLLGESFSGPVAITLAAESPPGLAGVILSSSFVQNPRPRLSIIRPLLPYLPFHGSGASVRLSRFLVLGRWITPALRELHQNILARVPATTMRHRLEAVADCDEHQALSRIRVPILCLAAKHDRLIPRSAIRTIQTYAPTAKVIELEAPHCLLQCAPREAVTNISAFLQSAGTQIERRMQAAPETPRPPER
jgi:pimeloyl-ACP methyl ester carboxylesterase